MKDSVYHIKNITDYIIIKSDPLKNCTTAQNKTISFQKSLFS